MNLDKPNLVGRKNTCRQNLAARIVSVVVTFFAGFTSCTSAFALPEESISVAEYEQLKKEVRIKCWEGTSEICPIALNQGGNVFANRFSLA
jgi:hypothetical protein